MFESDYLMRMIQQLIEAIVRSMEAANGTREDPAAAADLLEAAIGAAVDMDSSVFLSLAPESIADILSVSGTDEHVAEYVGRSLFLESDYLLRSGNDELARIREDQARALGSAYGFSLDEGMDPEDAMKAYLATQDDHSENQSN